MLSYKNWAIALIAFALLCGVFSGSAFGQAVTGRIIGTLTDESGAAIPNADIEVVNQETGNRWTVKTDRFGNFIVLYLPAGTYRVKAASTGFETAIAENNIVAVAQTARVDFAMKVGSVSTAVEVTAAAPMVQSASSDTGAVLTERQIENTPLNGRIFSQVVTLLPGTVQAGWQNAPESASGAGSRTPISASVNGVRWSGTTFTVDGVNNMEPLNAFMNVTPPIDAIQEIRVEMSNPTAEVGVYGGALVNVNIKSGTNRFHGSAFEYLRNDALNARSFFDPGKAPFKTNQFGGTAGGPIKRNKAFFFADYQGTIVRNGEIFTSFVPTDLMRQGIFSASEGFGTIYHPGTTTVYAGNRIPTSDFNPVTAKVLNLYPKPNTNIGANLNDIPFNYAVSDSTKEALNQVDIKGDYQFSDSSRVFVRESYVHRNLSAPTFGSPFLQGNGDVNAQSRNHNAVVGYTKTFTANLLNELRAGFNRFDTFHYGNDFGTDMNNQLGIPNGNIPGLPNTTGVADFYTGYAPDLGTPGWSDALRLSNTYQLIDNLTWIRGKHSLKVGVDLNRLESTLTNPEDTPRGYFDFSGNYTSGQGLGGNQFADFLLGLPDYIGRSFVAVVPAVRIPRYGAYVQDDWRITRKLTLNLGLRYDYLGHPYERHNRQTNFSLADGLFHVATPDNRGPNVDNFSGFAPRIGLAYTPDGGKTALRGGFGISYFGDNFGATGGTLERNFPLFQTYGIQAPDTYTPFWNVATNGLPPFLNVPLAPTYAPPEGLTVMYMAQNFKPSTVAMWNFGVQRQITDTMALDVAYVGNHSYQLYRAVDINTPIAPGPGLRDLRRPYHNLVPQVASIYQRGKPGDSHYNALQTKFTKRYSYGLQAMLSYTWSQQIDDLSVFWPWNDQLNRSRTTGSFRPHNFVASYSYELPFGKGRKFGAARGAFVDAVAGGWMISGITSLYSGRPFTIGLTPSRLNTGTGNRPNLTCPQVSRIGSLNQWFDTNCFAAPPDYVFGNAGGGLVLGPGVVNFDLSGMKQFRFGENRGFELRVDAFNAFNHPHFGQPNATYGGPGFGQVTSTVLTPREVQLGARLFF